jgi:hypothetical protein
VEMIAPSDGRNDVMQQRSILRGFASYPMKLLPSLAVQNYA